MAYFQLSQTLAESFNALADEVQGLADRKTVLEHKLRFAHEQFQYLADKYAPATPEIAETLAKLQLPPHTSVDKASVVPLPQRASPPPPSQHQIALVIRDGRRAASRLASLGEASKTTGSSRDPLSRTSTVESSSMSTALEQDFTVEGKKGHLQCPFSGGSVEDVDGSGALANEMETYDRSDPICAAMYEDTASNPTGTTNSAAGKCPIRYLDKHSPEEVARYVELHKHELPRSHEVCLRRYQRNEDQIRKLDNKYGNIVSMIEDLGQLHQPMLPEDDKARGEADNASNERVETWAQAVSVSTGPEASGRSVAVDDDRQSHFDRPLKEVRVGESPSRPWGISVPIYEREGLHPDDVFSPPAAPVRMPSPQQSARPSLPAKATCPFDNTKLAAFSAQLPHPPKRESGSELQGAPPVIPHAGRTPRPRSRQGQPVLVSPGLDKSKAEMPQMTFTGPVFIGYPIEQAIQLMNQYQRSQ